MPAKLQDASLAPVLQEPSGEPPPRTEMAAGFDGATEMGVASGELQPWLHEVGTAAAVRTRAAVRCRRTTPRDHDAVVDLLARGFPARSRADWRRIVDRLRAHCEREGIDHFGQVLECDGALVGILLKIFHRDGAGQMRCNVSSWYVEERLRSYGSMLVATATRDAAVTYLNVTAARATRRTVEAQGFIRYAEGVFLAAPLLSRTSSGDAKAMSGIELPQGFAADPGDSSVMAAEAHSACIRLWVLADGFAHPFMLVRRRIGRFRISAAHVVYCRDPADIVRFARPLGLALAKVGILLMTIDADEPIPGLPGRFLPGRMPKFFKGPVRPRLGDLAFTEIAMFGL